MPTKIKKETKLTKLGKSNKAANTAQNAQNISDQKFFMPALLPFEESDLSKPQEELRRLLEKDTLTAAEEKKFIEQKNTFNTRLKKLHTNLNNWQKTQISRHIDRPYALDYINNLCTNFVEFHGDRLFKDDAAIVGGFANFNGQSVCVVGNQKGRGMVENMKRNFGMAQPEGYRKALRLFKLASKFGKPIITFVDTPGAYPGIEAEERGQGEAIARNLQEMFSLEVPIIVYIIGEGGSGGALALAVGNSINMLQHAVYSVISPESCASILWRDAAFREEAAIALKNDAETAKKNKLIDFIIEEPQGGAHRNSAEMYARVHKSLKKDLKNLCALSKKEILATRIAKFADMGVFIKK